MYNETAKIKLRDIGRTLRSYRMAAGYAQQSKLANVLGVNVMTVSRWENGKAAMSQSNWEALMHLFHRKNEPYPYPSHTGNADETNEEHVTRTIIDPALVAETKALREMLSAEVRGMRDILQNLPALTRDAVCVALRDSAPELRSIHAQLSPLSAELKLLKDQLVVAVKEELAARPAPRKWEKRAEREHKEPAVAYDPDNPEVQALMKLEILNPITRSMFNFEPLAKACFANVHLRGFKVGMAWDKYPVNVAAISLGFTSGSALRWASDVGIDPPAEDVQEFVKHGVERLKELGFPYADGKGAAELMALSYRVGRANIPPGTLAPVPEDEDEDEDE